MHNYDFKTPYVDIYTDLLPINFNLLPVLYLALCLPSDQWFWNLYLTKQQYYS